jgi:hypothetical protein
MKSTDFLREDTPKKPTKTKVDTKPKPNLDNMFKSGPDHLPSAPKASPEPEQPAQEPKSPSFRKASQSDTLRAASKIHPTDQMRDMLGRMRNIDADPDDPGYPEPEQQDLPSTEVNTENLPAIAGSNLQAAGIQNPKFHQVASLPGNMSQMIRTLGRKLFGSMTRTDTKDIWMIANLGGQGPNTTQEVNAVANWLKESGKNLGPGNIDFDAVMPGYNADTYQFSAGGIRWLLVKDFAGQYIYCWPEADSKEISNQARIGR